MRTIRSSKHSFFAILIFAIMITGLNSCSNNDPVSPPEDYPNMPEYVSGGVYVDDLIIINISIENSAYIENHIDSDKAEFGLQFCEKGPEYNFRPIFQKLHLTQDQLNAIHQYMLDHYNCQKIARTTYYNTILQFIDNANTQRTAVLDSLSRSLIDTSSAVLRLSQINSEMHFAIDSSNARVVLINSLTDCVQTLFVNVNLILTDKQKEKWVKWHDHHKRYHPGNGIGWGLGRWDDWDD